MRRLGLLTLAVTTLVLLGEVLWAGDARAGQKSLKDQVVGTWMVSGWEQVGPGLKRFDGNLKGVNVFDANGQFFVMFARSRLLRIASDSPLIPTPGEAKDLAALIAYTPGTPDEAEVLDGGVIATTAPTPSTRRTIQSFCMSRPVRSRTRSVQSKSERSPR
jgi:hypothetical protein